MAGIAHYRVEGEACPQLLLRVLGLFAQNGQVPDRLNAGRCADRLSIRVTTRGLTEHRATIVAAKIEAIVGATKVDLKWSA